MIELIEEALFAQLSGDAAVSEIVGNQIFPMQAPEYAKPPYITYREKSSSEGDSASETEVTKTFLIESHPAKSQDSDSYRSGKQLAEAVKTALRNPFTQDGFCVFRVQVGTQTDELYTGIHQHGVGALFNFIYYIEGY